MTLPNNILEKLVSTGFLVAKLPSSRDEYHIWLAIYLLPERLQRIRSTKYVVRYIVLHEKYLHQYWEENIDIGGYHDCAEYHESWKVPDEDELERVVMEKLDDPMLFLQPQEIPYKYPF